jgi:hypothetical protein
VLQFIALILFIVFFVGLATIAGIFKNNATTPLNKINRPKYRHVRHGWWNA